MNGGPWGGDGERGNNVAFVVDERLAYDGFRYNRHFKADSQWCGPAPLLKDDPRFDSTSQIILNKVPWDRRAPCQVIWIDENKQALSILGER